MTITLYELIGRNEQIKFSPHCWKSHLALIHKQLPFNSEPVQYMQKRKIAFSNQTFLPVLTDKETVVSDSWDIACYLEDNYTDRPSLFHGERDKMREFNHWCNTELTPYIRPIVLLDIYHLIAEEDKPYFRESRKQKIGMSIEAYSADKASSIQGLRDVLGEVRDPLTTQTYLGGDTINYQDISLAGMLLWISCVDKTLAFLEKDDPVHHWYQRILEQFPQTDAVINRQN